MTDRELLKLAAKAYGLELGKPAGDGYYNAYEPDDHHLRWNPLIDDAQALHLAVELNLVLMPYPQDKAVRVTRLDQPDTIVSWGAPPNPLAATRRAIVRAAAEIGKLTKSPV